MAHTNALGHTVDDVSAQPSKRREINAHAHRSETVGETLIGEELKALLKAELVKEWHWQRKWTHREALRLEWSTLDSELILLRDLAGQVEPSKVRLLCNRTTAFYWLPEAQRLDAYGKRNILPRAIIAAIHGQWFESFQGSPNIEYGHFVANCVRVAPTGPSTIHETIDAHLSLCTQASHLLSRDQCGGKNQHRSLLPSYWSVILVMDSSQYALVPSDSKHRWSLSEIAATQTLLIIRTGVKAGLGIPISFEGLTSLPLNRSDLAGIDAIRVSLSTAVQFIIGLEKQEMSQAQQSRPEPPIDASICPDISHLYHGDPDVYLNPEKWADAILAEAEEHGYDNQFVTQYTLRRIHARSLGEELEPEYPMFSSRLKP